MLNDASRRHVYLPSRALRPSVLDVPLTRRAVGRERREAPFVGDEAIPSTATVRTVGDYLEALHAGDDAHADFLKDVVESWRADNAAGGNAVYEHAPLPHRVADTIAKLLGEPHEGPEPPTLEKIVERLDLGARLSVAQQIAAQIGRPADDGGLRTEDDVAARQLTDNGPSDAGDDGLDVSRASATSHLLTFPLDGLIKRRDELNSPIKGSLEDALRSYRESGGVDNWTRRSGEAGAQRTMEYRAESDKASLRTLPFDPQRDGVGFQEVGMLNWRSRAAKAAWDWAKRKGKDAVAGGVLSALAQWHVSHEEGKDPEATDIVLAFITGAITGGWDPKRGKAELDAALAIGSSLFGDSISSDSSRPVSVPKALGAGFAAWGVTKFSGQRWLSQGLAKYGRKYLEKYIKKFLKDLFGDEFELTKQEMGEFLTGLREYWQEQYNEFLYLDDTNPLPADVR